jgi:hypothetical protein
MREELARRGVQVDQNLARPEDELWLRTALDMAGAEASNEELDAEQDREVRFEHTEEDQARMAEHVRAAWSEYRAGLVVDREAWGALAYTMHRLEHQGHDVRQMLRGLPDVSRARTPAALTVWLLEQSVAQAAADEQVLANEQRGVERDERTIEGDWRDEEKQAPVSTVEQAAAAGEADLAGGQADTAADRGDSHETTAAALAARAATAYPATTDSVVADARTHRPPGVSDGPRSAGKGSAGTAQPRPAAGTER